MKTLRSLPCLILMMSILHCPVHAQAETKSHNSQKYGFAAWYQVPRNSLARRRAASGEFTAAHNRLPLGTLVRVTRLSNQCSVLVRITDRGITNRRANIDVCKEAAEELGMIREGLIRVRMEIISEPPIVSAPEAAIAAP